MWLDLPDQSSGGGGYVISQDTRNVFGQSRGAGAQAEVPSDNASGQMNGEIIAGFVLYRLENGVVEYLLLKKVGQNDWSPPKGHVESGEDKFEGAVREVAEETHLSFGDYEVLEQYPIYFEYKTRQQVLKKVNLWAARYLNYDKPVRLSEEHDEFQWLDYESAITVIKHQYRSALVPVDLVVRTYESL